MRSISRIKLFSYRNPLSSHQIKKSTLWISFQKEEAPCFLFTFSNPVFDEMHPSRLYSCYVQWLYFPPAASEDLWGWGFERRQMRETFNEMNFFIKFNKFPKNIFMAFRSSFPLSHYWLCPDFSASFPSLSRYLRMFVACAWNDWPRMFACIWP